MENNKIEVNKELLDKAINSIENTTKIEWGGGQVIDKTEDGRDIYQMPYAKYPRGLYETLLKIVNRIKELV